MEESEAWRKEGEEQPWTEVKETGERFSTIEIAIPKQISKSKARFFELSIILNEVVNDLEGFKLYKRLVEINKNESGKN